MKFCERPFQYAYLADKGEVWPCGWMHFVIGNLYDFHKGHYWFKDLPALGFQGPVISIEEFIEGKNQ